MSEPSFDIPTDLAEKLRAARYVVVLTGAGVSTESAIDI